MGERMTIEATAPLGAWLDPLFTEGAAAAQFSSVVENDIDGSFTEAGTISFGTGQLSFVTEGSGQLVPSVDAAVQHGTVIWRIEGGTGAFEQATGFITSNFTVSEDAAVMDTQSGVIFLPD